MRSALEQAKQAREFILEKMAEAISETRGELADHAPRISSVKIDPDKIGMVIGKGGETIRALESDHDVQIDIEEDGTILIYATEGAKANSAIEAIQSLTKEPEVGDTYTGKVVKTTQFGAFVELTKGTDGLLHVSNVGPGRVGHIEDVIKRGDVLDVIVQEVDKARGRIGLKLVALHENGSLVQPEELIERAKDAPPREREERDDRRGGDRARRPRPRRATLAAVLALAAIRLGLALAGLEAAIAAGATTRAAGLGWLLGSVGGAVFVLADRRGAGSVEPPPRGAAGRASGGRRRCARRTRARSGSPCSLRSHSLSARFSPRSWPE